MNIKKKKIGGRVWLGGRVGGVRVDVNEELKLLGKFTKKNFGGGRGGLEGGAGSGGGGQVGGSGWWGGVRVDVNEELKFL